MYSILKIVLTVIQEAYDNESKVCSILECVSDNRRMSPPQVHVYCCGLLLVWTAYGLHSAVSFKTRNQPHNFNLALSLTIGIVLSVASDPLQ